MFVYCYVSVFAKLLTPQILRLINYFPVHFVECLLYRETWPFIWTSSEIKEKSLLLSVLWFVCDFVYHVQELFLNLLNVYPVACVMECRVENYELGRLWKGAVVGKTVFMHFPAGTGENHEHSQPGLLFSGRVESNMEHLEYDSINSYCSTRFVFSYFWQFLEIDKYINKCVSFYYGSVWEPRNDTRIDRVVLL